MTEKLLRITVLRCSAISSAAFYASAVFHKDYWLMLPHGVVMLWVVYLLVKEEHEQKNNP